MSERTITISQSRVKTFINCRRKYFLEYVEGLRPVEDAEALKIGSEYHDAIAGKSIPVSPMGIALKSAYDKYIHIPMLEMEKEFTYHLGYGVYIHGFMDGLTADSIVEHKTASIVNDQYFCNLQKDLQISVYMLCQGLNRITYSVIQKPSIRLKKEETQEEFADRLIHWFDDAELNFSKVFVRVESRTNEDLKECAKELHQVAREMRSCKTFYKNPGACSIFPCAYNSICLNYEPSFVPMGFEKKI